MKTKEKLERSGWRFIHFWWKNYEVYERGNLRVIYSPEDELVIAYWDDSKRDNGYVNIILVDDILFEFLTEKE